MNDRVFRLFLFLWALSHYAFSQQKDFAALREAMVNTQLKEQGITSLTVLNAMRKVERHLFVPAEFVSQAYEDHPLPIGEGQTISQPYMVAFMTEALQLKGDEKVLEIGTGSGYRQPFWGSYAKKFIPSKSTSLLQKNLLSC